MRQATKILAPPVHGQAMALLVIDVQQGLFRKSTPIVRAELLLSTLTTLIECAHAAGVPVIHIQHASDEVSLFGSADWQLYARLQPDVDDLVVQKQPGNGCEDTPLHAALVERGVSRVIGDQEQT